MSVQSGGGVEADVGGGGQLERGLVGVAGTRVGGGAGGGGGVPGVRGQLVAAPLPHPPQPRALQGLREEGPDVGAGVGGG